MEPATATAIGSLSSTPCSELKPDVCKKEVEFSPSKTPEKKPTEPPFTLRRRLRELLLPTKLNEMKALEHKGNSVDTKEEIHAHGSSSVAEGGQPSPNLDFPHFHNLRSGGGSRANAGGHDQRGDSSDPDVPEENTLPVLVFTDNLQSKRHDRLETRNIRPTQYIDMEILHTWGIGAEVAHYIENIGWTEFINIQRPSYSQVVYEFLSTLTVRKDDQTPIDITFRAFNKDYTLGLPAITQHLHLDPTGILCCPGGWSWSWSRISKPGTAFSASSLRSPALRIIHRFLARSVCARGGGTSRVRDTECYLLDCMVQGIRVNAAPFIIRQLELIATRATGEIRIGGYITALLECAGAPGPDTFGLTPEGGDTLIDYKTLASMGICKGEGRRYVLGPPLPAAEDVSKDPPAPSSLGHGAPTSSPPSAPAPPPSPKGARGGPSEPVPHRHDGNGLGFEKTKTANVDHFGNLNNQSLNRSFDSAISRVTTLPGILRQGVDSLEQELTRLEAVEKKSNGDIVRLQQELESVTKDRDRWMERFTNEVSTGREFHQSEAGQRFLEEIKKEHLDMFKRSVSFKRLVADEATDIFDQTVQECRKKLKKTGRFPHNGSF